MAVSRHVLTGLSLALVLGMLPFAAAAPAPAVPEPKAKTKTKTAPAPVPPPAPATPPAAAPPAAARVPRKAKPKPVPVSEPVLPPVSLKLELSESGPDEQWRLKLENTSGKTVRVGDELRLLWFDVTLPGGKPKTCKLPAELVPKDLGEKTIEELDPGESLVHRLDPRFYCFSPDKQELLVPTAQVTPHYGWPSKTRRVYRKGRAEEEPLPDQPPPFVAVPVDSTTAGPLKNVVGNSLVLDDRYATWAMDTASPDEDAGNEPVLEMVRGSDAKSELSVTATVRVRNPGKSRLQVFVRRELITFEVLTPRGTVACASEPDKRNPDKRAFTTLAPHASMKLVSRLVELCPRGTFAKSGIYLVHARFDAAADGEDFGLDAFTGTLRTGKPVPVRVRNTIRIIPNRTVGPPGQMPMAQMAAPPLNAPPPQAPPPPPPPQAPPPPPAEPAQ